MNDRNMDIDRRLNILMEAVDNWLNPENEYLSRAIDQTVQEGYFAFHDIKHSLLTLKDTVTAEYLERWIKNTGADSGIPGKNVLCLHAGNLPLVGLQNVLAVLLSGGRYMGKISRKDPYLLPTFLNEVKKTSEWSSVDVQWIHNLDDIEGLQSDAILFTGSGESVPGVKEAIHRLNLGHESTRYLIRTAHFSIAYLDNRKPEHMENLVEAIFRYGGKGCRSVAIVVSPFELDEIKCDLTDYIESFWLDHPQHEKPQPSLGFRYAYNKSVNRSQSWLDNFLIQQGGFELDQDFICYWSVGGPEKIAELAETFSEQVQSIYITGDNIKIPGIEKRTEMLSAAQHPPIDWKPDGIDTLEWLLEI